MPMTARSPLPPTKSTGLVVFASLIIPGLGQFLIRRWWRGLMIFVSTAALIYLIDWSLVHQNIAKVTLGGTVTSALWLPLFCFWIWNVSDVRALVRGKVSNALPGIVLASSILYVIAWNVTDVRLNRLVERFNDARTVASNLLNPDMITISVNGEDQICSWSCMYMYVGNSLAGQPTAGPIRLSDNLLDIVGR